MKPENIGKMIELNQEAAAATTAAKEFEVSHPELVEGVEQLLPEQRFNRIWELVKLESEGRETGKVYLGRAPGRTVTDTYGKTYTLSFSISAHTKKTKHINADWIDLETFEHFSETLDDTWVVTHPSHERGSQILTNLEWTVDAYLNAK
jgi:hypothetical protein